MDPKAKVRELIEEAKKDPGVWKDDGCGFTGTAREVDDHILEINKEHMQSGAIERIRCWGRFKVEHGKGKGKGENR